MAVPDVVAAHVGELAPHADRIGPVVLVAEGVVVVGERIHPAGVFRTGEALVGPDAGRALVIRDESAHRAPAELVVGRRRVEGRRVAASLDLAGDADGAGGGLRDGAEVEGPPSALGEGQGRRKVRPSPVPAVGHEPDVGHLDVPRRLQLEHARVLFPGLDHRGLAHRTDLDRRPVDLGRRDASRQDHGDDDQEARDGDALRRSHGAPPSSDRSTGRESSSSRASGFVRTAISASSSAAASSRPWRLRWRTCAW